MLTSNAAARLILHQLTPLSRECVGLTAALDRVLATAIRSPIALPPWDNSAMDGYAVQSADLERDGEGDARSVLRVVDEVPAGRVPDRAVGPGEAIRVFTGAPVPDGADTVVRQEDTEPVDAERVAIIKRRDIRKHIRRRGEDIGEGDTVLTAGQQLGAAELGVLASIAQREVDVHRRPRVAIIAVGDEVVDLDRAEEVLDGSKIATSNTYTLRANIERAGGVAVNLGIARDTPESLRKVFTQATDVDFIVTTAGISVGTHDHVRPVIESLDGEIRFWRLPIRPGAPVGFGMVGDTPWLGLPGNPVSTMVTFELFARPAIRRLAGHPRAFRRAVKVREFLL